MAHDVFISYSHKDKTTADAICSHLEGRDIRCWYAPRDIAPGTEWGVEILKGIEQAKIMVLVFTKDANLSQQVLREVNNAVNAGLVIIPFRLTEEEPAAGMKYYLSTVHWMDAMNEELDTAIHALCDRCKAVLEKKPVPVASSGVSAQVTGATGAGTQAASAAVSKKSGTGKKVLIGVLVAIAALVLFGVVRFSLFIRGLENEINEVSSEYAASETASDGNDVDGEDSTAEDGGTNDSSTDITYAEGDEIKNLGAISDNVSTDLGETYTQGNNQNNLNWQNGGYLAYDGSYYYFRSNDGGKMVRMSEDGSDRTVLTEAAVKSISVLDGKIYFIDEDANKLCSMSTDGSDKTELYDMGSEESARILGDRIYFVSYGLESIALDGTDRRLHNSIYGYDTVLDGTYQYYADPEHGAHLYRAKMDGTEAECIYDHETLSLRIAGNFLFFFDSDDAWEKTYDLATGEVTQLFADPANTPVITKDGIYGPNGSMRLTFIPLSGMGTRTLTEEMVSNTNVAGNKILYSTGDKLHLMDLDGSNKTEA